MTSCRELDNNRSALSAASAFAIATAGANEGTPHKEKYRRMSLASAGAWGSALTALPEVSPAVRPATTALIPGPCPPHGGWRLLLQALAKAGPPARSLFLPPLPLCYWENYS